LAEERGDYAEAARSWNDVLAECPGDREAMAKLKRARALAEKGVRQELRFSPIGMPQS
jgi:cytochrome c-type biogenesis protein CcmH/NrfG